MGSREATSSTDPRTVVAGAGAASHITPIALKKVRHSQVIVIVQPVPHTQTLGPHLSAFEAEDNIGRQAVHQVGGESSVLSDAAGPQVAAAVLLLASKQIEGKARRQQKTELSPASVRVHRINVLVAHDAETLPDAADVGHVAAAEKRP